MKVIITESQYNKAIDFYISHLLEPHEVKTSKDYPNSIFWIKNGEIIVEIRDSKYFWLHQDTWNYIPRMFELNYSETKSVIKKWLEQHYDLGEVLPAAGGWRKQSMLEQHHNLG